MIPVRWEAELDAMEREAAGCAWPHCDCAPFDEACRTPAAEAVDAMADELRRDCPLAEVLLAVQAIA